MAVFIERDTKKYPIYESQIRQLHPNVSFPREMSQSAVEGFGFDIVNPTERPSGDVVTEGEPVQLQDGSWEQTWMVREYNEEELAARANITREDMIKNGVPYTFPGSDTPDAIQIHDRDMTILNTLRIFAKDNIDNPEYVQIFRSLNNNNYHLTAQDVLDMTEHVFTTVQSIYQQSWELKDK